jgi:tetratricopeptide (TPR) repeat protein
MGMNTRVFLSGIILTVLVGCGNAEYMPSAPETQISTTPTSRLITPTPIWTPTLTPTATPTPLPDAVYQAAQHAYQNGDWTAAEILYSQLLQSYALQDSLRIQALLGLGKVHLANGEHALVLDVLAPILTGSFDDEIMGTAHQIAAEVLIASGQPLEAATHYAAVRHYYPILAAYTFEWEGDAQYRANDYKSALELFLSAVEVADTEAFQARLQEKIGLCQSALGEYKAAMAAYDTVMAVYDLEIATADDEKSLSAIDKQRARILYQTVETAQLFNDSPEATRRMQRLVNEFPKQIYA